MRYELKIPEYGFLDPEGNLLCKEEDLPAFARDPNELTAMYRAMVLTRVVDQKAVNMHKTGMMGTYASSLGEEAVDVGTGYALDETLGNIFAPYYRNHGTLLVMFGPEIFSKIFLFWGGDERGNMFADADRCLPFAVPIGTQFPIAVGLAKGRRLLGKEGVVVVSGGDGSTSKGDFNTSLNEAAVRKLPVVFLIKNNQYAISMPVKEQTATRPLALRGGGFAVYSMIADGNDVIAVRHAVGLAIARAREGKGPVLVEAQTYRLADHTTVDAAKDYRDQEEVDRARANEPLLRLRRLLIRRGWWDDAREAALLAESERKAEEIKQGYLAIPRQRTEDLVEFLYEKIPDVYSYREQLAELKRKGV